MAFRFRLQRVLDLRARVEQDAARALASAQEAAATARAELAAIEAVRAELAATANPGAGHSVGTLRTVGFLLGRMDEQVVVAEASTAAAERTANERRDVLQLAWRDRRTLDRLRERHHDAWKGAEAALDRQTMDEVALARFTQDGAAPRE